MEETQFTDEEKQTIFKYILEYADTTSIVNIAQGSNFTSRILEDSQFLSIIDEEDRLKEIIRTLEISFKELDFQSSPQQLLEFILEKNHYELNPFMVRSMIKEFGELNQSVFDNSNYSAIKQSKCENLISYVESDINQYIKNVFLAIESNSHEAETSLQELLNNSEIEYKNKESIVRKTKTKITDAASIKSSVLVQTIFIENKVEPTWENLTVEFKHSGNIISDTSIGFINILKNAQSLSNSKMPKTISIDEDEESIEYARDLILRNDINDTSYSAILNSIPDSFEDLAFEELSAEKVNQLIEQSILEPTLDNYNRLLDGFDESIIKFIIKNPDEFLQLFKEDDIELDSNDLNLILKSSKIKEGQKIGFVDVFDLETISQNLGNLKLIAEILLDDPEVQVNTELYDIILVTKGISVENRIALFARKSNHKYDDIEDFLTALGDDYHKITYKNKRAKLLDNSHNRILLKALERVDYISSFSQIKGLIDAVMGIPKLRVNHKRK